MPLHVAGLTIDDVLRREREPPLRKFLFEGGYRFAHLVVWKAGGNV
jgi:hypothetical protein